MRGIDKVKKDRWCDEYLSDVLILDDLRKGVVETLHDHRREAESERVEDHLREGEGMCDWCAEESSYWVGFVGVIVLNGVQLDHERPVRACGQLWHTRGAGRLHQNGGAFGGDCSNRGFELVCCSISQKVT